VAGGGSTEGLIAINSPVIRPSNVAVDAFGNLYFAVDHRIKKVNASTGIMSTIAGNGTIGYGGDGNLAVSAILNQPSGIALDSSGNLYFADLGNNRIRKINTITGIISTIAGNGYYGNGGSGYYGDGVPSATSTLNNPYGMAVDSMDNLYIADRNNHMIRKITASTGIINTIAGNGNAGYGGDGSLAVSATLNTPTFIALDRSGNIYFVDGGIRIRKINASTGIITTVAGNPNGYDYDGVAASAAVLNSVAGIAIDPSNNLYIASLNSDYKYTIRKVTASTGIISTIAGSGASKFQEMVVLLL